jgi:hypothetical protein
VGTGSSAVPVAHRRSNFRDVDQFGLPYSGLGVITRLVRPERQTPAGLRDAVLFLGRRRIEVTGLRRGASGETLLRGCTDDLANWSNLTIAQPNKARMTLVDETPGEGKST